MASLTALKDGIVNSQVWKSVFRVGIPNTNRKRVLAVLGSLILHLHPVKVRRSGVRMSYTWCMGGTSFFLFLVETVTGLLLMFYYRPTIEYAFTDIMDLREQAPFGIMREMHRWGAHAMVIAVWLHMFRVFMTGSYKPPREFNWNIGVILLGSRSGPSRSARTWPAPRPAQETRGPCRASSNWATYDSSTPATTPVSRS